MRSEGGAQGQMLRNIVMPVKVDRLVDLQRDRPAGPLPATRPCHAPQEPHRAPPVPSNSVSPFHTEEKPTCGFRFSWNTDHRRRRTDICPSNPVMWRSN